MEGGVAVALMKGERFDSGELVVSCSLVGSCSSPDDVPVVSW